MKVVRAVLAFLTLAGCATMEDSKSKEPPPSRLTVYREPSSRDSLFPMLIFVDGRPVAQLQPDEEHSFRLSPGDHRLQYELGLYHCSEKVLLESGKGYISRLAQGCVIALVDPP